MSIVNDSLMKDSKSEDSHSFKYSLNLKSQYLLISGKFENGISNSPFSYQPIVVAHISDFTKSSNDFTRNRKLVIAVSKKLQILIGLNFHYAK